MKRHVPLSLFAPALLLLPVLAAARPAPAPPAPGTIPPGATPRGFSTPLAETPAAAPVAARTDTLFLFAAAGPGAYGSPGTDARGYTFDGPGGTAEPAGWFGVDLTGQTGVWWHVAETAVCAGHGTDMGAALPFDPGDTVNDHALWCGRLAACNWQHLPGYGNGWDQIASVDLGGMA
ncbi:MAG: hypothetical protein JW819_03360, partial [Candidatus Krumholzibacteriota bacterium]|nr:hypothetical protein [Candidatus Krumholzibacteriota bacterium]